jgi:hypothetical protein
LKTYQIGNKRIWYDPHERVWTLQRIDEEENQVGDCEYTTGRKNAFNWLKGKEKWGQPKNKQIQKEIARLVNVKAPQIRIKLK